MRVILTGISSFCIIMLVVVIMVGPLEGKVSDPVAIFVLTLTCFLAVFVSNIIFSERSPHEPFQTIEELENQGLVTSTEYKATRAIQVEEFEDEGSTYYVELNDKKHPFPQRPVSL